MQLSGSEISSTLARALVAANYTETTALRAAA